jgi:hypothetical protein
MVCGRCGSIRIRTVKGTAFARAVSWALRKTLISCGRCGWQGRVGLQERLNGQGSKHKSQRGRRVEPVLADEVTLDLPPLNLDEGGTNLSAEASAKAEVPPLRSEIDLAALDRALSAGPDKARPTAL